MHERTTPASADWQSLSSPVRSLGSSLGIYILALSAYMSGAGGRPAIPFVLLATPEISRMAAGSFWCRWFAESCQYEGRREAFFFTPYICIDFSTNSREHRRGDGLRELV